MYANRFASERRFHPASMGVALAINGGLLAAMLLAGSVTVIRRDDPVLTTINVPLPPPLPMPFVPKPVVDLPRPEQPVVASQPALPVFPSPPTGVAGGTGTTATAEPVKPAPVLVDAAPDPRYLAAFQPDYPASERRAERDGVVTVRVRIGTDGRVHAVEQLRATSDAFWQATERQALSRWRFRAATRDGVAVESWRVMTVRFTMQD